MDLRTFQTHLKDLLEFNVIMIIRSHSRQVIAISPSVFHEFDSQLSSSRKYVLIIRENIQHIQWIAARSESNKVIMWPLIDFCCNDFLEEVVLWPNNQVEAFLSVRVLQFFINHNHKFEIRSGKFHEMNETAR